MKLQQIKDFLDDLEEAIPSSETSYHRIYLYKGSLMISLFLPDEVVLPLCIFEEDLISDTDKIIDEIKYHVSHSND